MALNQADAYAALREMAFGKGHKSAALGAALIEAGVFRGSLDSAAARVRAGLNPNNRECLTNIETLVLEQATGSDAFLRFHCRALGRGAPKVMRADEAKRQLRVQHQHLRERLDALEGQLAELDALSPGEAEPRFVPVEGLRFARVH